MLILCNKTFIIYVKYSEHSLAVKWENESEEDEEGCLKKKDFIPANTFKQKYYTSV